jgi:hypothetical protein
MLVCQASCPSPSTNQKRLQTAPGSGKIKGGRRFSRTTASHKPMATPSDRGQASQRHPRRDRCARAGSGTDGKFDCDRAVAITTPTPRVTDLRGRRLGVCQWPCPVWRDSRKAGARPSWPLTKTPPAGDPTRRTGPPTQRSATHACGSLACGTFSHPDLSNGNLPRANYRRSRSFTGSCRAALDSRTLPPIGNFTLPRRLLFN